MGIKWVLDNFKELFILMCMIIAHWFMFYQFEMHIEIFICELPEGLEFSLKYFSTKKGGADS